MTDLPATWRRETIADLACGGLFCDGDWVESKDQDPTGSVRLTQLADVGVGTFRDRSDRWLREDQAAGLGCTFLEPGDVLIARMPDPIGRACQVPSGLGRAVTAVDVAVLRPAREDVDPKYVMWAINSPEVHAQIAGLQSGTTRKRVSRKNLSTVRVPIPNLPEQRRIVETLEDHLSRLDAAAGYLTTAEQRLAQLPHVAERTLISASDVPPVPFESVFAPVSDGGRRVAQMDYLASGPVPVVDQGDGLIGGFTSVDDAYSGPLPVIVFGDHTRRAKYIDFRFAVGAQGVKLLRVRPGVAPRYGYYLVRSAGLPSRGYGRHYAMLRSLTFPVPSLERQAAVVRELDSINEAASDTAATLAALEKRRSTLRQAVLGAAFSGRLTGGASGPDLADELAAASGVPTA